MKKPYNPMRCQEVVEACMQWTLLSVFTCFDAGIVPKNEEFFYNHAMRVSPKNVPKYINQQKKR